MPPASTVSNDANTFMPLLFAAHPDLVPNYRRMAAMDDQKRTYSALEHKFRNWRQAGKNILAEKGEEVDTAGVSPKKGPVANARRNKKVKKEDTESDEEDELGAEEAKGTKRAKVKTKKSNRASTVKDSSIANIPSSPGSIGPAKKAKKGTAKVIKKAKAKAREEVVTDEEDDDDAEEEGKSGVGAGKRPRRASKSGLRPKLAPETKAGSKRKMDVVEEEDEEAAMESLAQQLVEDSKADADGFVLDEEPEDDEQEVGNENEGEEGKEGQDEFMDMQFDQA